MTVILNRRIAIPEEQRKTGALVTNELKVSVRTCLFRHSVARPSDGERQGRAGRLTSEPINSPQSTAYTNPYNIGVCLLLYHPSQLH